MKKHRDVIEEHGDVLKKHRGVLKEHRDVFPRSYALRRNAQVDVLCPDRAINPWLKKETCE
ncbi:MAG: hypothetical protein JXB30_05625 [Anaerolineae bacterium]|nr:hypothetical protein [Anaerolineae bacterium]